MNEAMVLSQERVMRVVKGCGCCIYCYIGAPMNCHRLRGEAEPAEGLETIAVSIQIAAERCEWAADEVIAFLRLTGLFGVLGVGSEFRLNLGKFLFSVGLQGLMQQLVENAELERRRLAAEGNREFDEVFGGEDVEMLETEMEC